MIWSMATEPTGVPTEIDMWVNGLETRGHTKGLERRGCCALGLISCKYFNHYLIQMNISLYYSALGTKLNRFYLLFVITHAAQLLQARKNKEENRARQYLYPSQKFCSGPNKPSCKTFLDCIILSWPLLRNALLCGKTDLQITKSWLLMIWIWLILNSQYRGNENSSTHRKAICPILHKSLDLLHGPQKNK